MYDAPSLKAKALYVVGRDVPLEVIVNVEGWLKVRDAGGSVAWIEKKTISDKRMLMVRVAAADVLANPERVLKKLCGALAISWDPAMLSWAPGRRDTDGPWAPHWYGAVERSTGFSPPETVAVELPRDARLLADRCRPYYERLAVHRLTP